MFKIIWGTMALRQNDIVELKMKGGGKMKYEKPTMECFSIEELTELVCEMGSMCKSCYTSSW